MDEDNPRKFSLATPQQGTSAYLRCLTISPPSKRVIEDWNGVIDSMWRIREYQGIVVPDAKGKQMRQGHRAAAARIGAENVPKRGGYHPWQQALDEYNQKYKYHPDASSGLLVKLENSREKFAEA
jgi:hypothetical protein